MSQKTILLSDEQLEQLIVLVERELEDSEDLMGDEALPENVKYREDIRQLEEVLKATYRQ